MTGSISSPNVPLISQTHRWIFSSTRMNTQMQHRMTFIKTKPDHLPNPNKQQKKKTVIFVVYLLKSKCHTRLILKYSCLLQTWQTRQNDRTGHCWLLRRLGELNTLLLDAMKQILGSLEVPKQKNPKQNKTKKRKKREDEKKEKGKKKPATTP